jgi:hypothetical protein
VGRPHPTQNRLIKQHALRGVADSRLSALMEMLSSLHGLRGERRCCSIALITRRSPPDDRSDCGLNTADGQMETFICHPERGGPYPAVFFLMDAHGIRDELQDMAPPTRDRRLLRVAAQPVLPRRADTIFGPDVSEEGSLRSLALGQGGMHMPRHLPALMRIPMGAPHPPEKACWREGETGTLIVVRLMTHANLVPGSNGTENRHKLRIPVCKCLHPTFRTRC